MLAFLPVPLPFVGTSWLHPAISYALSRQQAPSLSGSTPIHPVFGSDYGPPPSLHVFVSIERAARGAIHADRYAGFTRCSRTAGSPRPAAGRMCGANSSMSTLPPARGSPRRRSTASASSTASKRRSTAGARATAPRTADRRGALQLDATDPAQALAQIRTSGTGSPPRLLTPPPRPRQRRSRPPAVLELIVRLDHPIDVLAL
jgi:hypothetical protein